MTLPEGLVYQAGFITEPEEAALLEHVRAMQFSEVRMHGVIAKRRTVHLGWLYGYESWKVTPGPPIPDFLHPLRARAAAVIEVTPEDLAEVLITEYPAGAQIGWHRDAPQFGIVIGVSLLGAARMRFRRGEGPARQTAELTLAPRSLYVLDGPARTEWQHHIPATKEPRYSITFRTLRRKR
ncbi:MAG: alpha-ketoglutarate-dependent dioxygenase AlkB [Bryobacteraceae bacterium]|nr:alpha-ketoglutarate-dependent dioxygenase AlkB [Bryobacteraceae bacterium]